MKPRAIPSGMALGFRRKAQVRTNTLFIFIKSVPNAKETPPKKDTILDFIGSFFNKKKADVLKPPAFFCLYCQNLIISLDIVGIMVYYIAIVIHTIQL